MKVGEGQSSGGGAGAERQAEMVRQGLEPGGGGGLYGVLPRTADEGSSTRCFSVR